MPTPNFLAGGGHYDSSAIHITPLSQLSKEHREMLELACDTVSSLPSITDTSAAISKLRKTSDRISKLGNVNNPMSAVTSAVALSQYHNPMEYYLPPKTSNTVLKGDGLVSVYDSVPPSLQAQQFASVMSVNDISLIDLELPSGETVPASVIHPPKHQPPKQKPIPLPPNKRKLILD